MTDVISALVRLGRDRLGRRIATVSFIVLFLVYAAILPTSLTGGYIGWVSLQFLTPGLLGTAAALAAFLSLTVAMMVLLVREGRRSSKGVAAGGALLALMAPLLCCSPLLPLALGIFATVFPALVGIAAGGLQGFIASHESLLLGTSVALSGLAFWQNARRLVSAPSCRVPGKSGDGLLPHGRRK